MSVEYGLFSDEGLVEGDCWSREEAERAIADRYDPGDDLTIEKVCPTCREGIDGECENCDLED